MQAFWVEVAWVSFWLIQSLGANRYQVTPSLLTPQTEYCRLGLTMKKRRQQKKYIKSKKLISFLIGTYYKFDVLDPLSALPDITNTSYGHSNTIKAVMMKKNIIHLYSLFDSQRLKWKSTIDIEFQSGAKSYSRKAEIVWFGLLKECEGEYQQTIEDLFSIANMDHYVMCHITAEVIGLDAVKDSDFSISKAEAA